MNCDAKELRIENFLTLSCASDVFGYHKVSSLASCALVHEACSLSKGTELLDKLCIKWDFLVIFANSPSCFPTNTATAPAPHQEYQHNGSFEFNSSTAVNSTLHV
jgi:hypothetical protein